MWFVWRSLRGTSSHVFWSESAAPHAACALCRSPGIFISSRAAFPRGAQPLAPFSSPLCFSSHLRAPTPLRGHLVCRRCQSYRRPRRTILRFPGHESSEELPVYTARSKACVVGPDRDLVPRCASLRRSTRLLSQKQPSRLPSGLLPSVWTKFLPTLPSILLPTSRASPSHTPPPRGAPRARGGPAPPPGAPRQAPRIPSRAC